MSTFWQMCIAGATRPALRLLILLPATLSPALAQDTQPSAGDDDPAIRVRELVEQIQAVRAERAAGRQAHRDQVELFERQIARLKQDLALVRPAADAATARVGEAEQRLEALSSTLQAETQAIAGTARQVLPVAQQMAERIRTGLPYRRDSRQRQIAGIVAGLSSGDPTQQADALNSFWTFAGDELRYLRSTEFWNQPVVLPDGRQVHAYQIRLGLVGQLFVSEQGDVIGLAGGAGTPSWQTNLPDSVSEQVRAIADVLRRRKPPGLVAVPIDPPAPVPVAPVPVAPIPAAPATATSAAPASPATSTQPAATTPATGEQ